MELSYQEILHLLERLGRSADGFAFRGSTSFLGAGGQPCESEAVRDLVARGSPLPTTTRCTWWPSERSPTWPPRC